MKFPELSALLKKELAAIPIKRKSKNLFVNLLSQFYLEDLNSLINHFDLIYEDVNFETLHFVFVYLCKHWLKVKKTPLSYLRNPDIHINQAMMLLANEIVKYTKNALCEILMPDVKFNLLKEDLANLNFYDVILADNGVIPIKISRCILNAFYNGGIFTHSIPGKEKCYLTKNERQQVIFHSANTFQFFKQWMLNDNRLDLLAVMTKAHQEYCQAESEITEKDNEEDNENLMNLILPRLKNLHDLAALLSEKLVIDEWQQFLQAIDTHHLQAIVLQGSFEKVATDLANFTGDEMHDKAMLFCLSEILRREYGKRKEEEERKFMEWNSHNFNLIDTVKLVADTTYRFLKTFSPQQKLSSIKIFQEFLLDKYVHLSELEKFIEKKCSLEQQAALLNGRLKILIERAMHVETENYFSVTPFNSLAYLTPDK